MDDCIFCKIVSRKIPKDPKEIVFEDSEFMAFYDLHPKAPVHIQIIPKAHLTSVKDLKPGEEKLTGIMVRLAKNIAVEKGLAGYKLIFNVGREGGQVIDHLHLHLLGGWGEAPRTVEI